MKAFIHNWIQHERVFTYCYIFPRVESCKTYFDDSKHNILRSAPKYTRTFVLGIIYPSRLTVSLTEEIMFTDEYPCIFSAK